MNCPACGRPTDPSATHCASCGTPLGWSEAPPPPPPPLDGAGTVPPPPPPGAGGSGADPSLAQFGPAIQASLGIIQLDRGAIRRVAMTETATTMAVVFLAISGALWGLGHFHIFGLVLGPIAFLVGAAISVGIVHLVATVLGGKGEYLSLFRCHGFLSVFGVVGIVPILGSIALMFLGLWELVVLVPILETTHALSRERAILTVAILLGVAILLSAVLTVGLFLMGVSLLALLGAH